MFKACGYAGRLYDAVEVTGTLADTSKMDSTPALTDAAKVTFFMSAYRYRYDVDCMGTDKGGASVNPALDDAGAASDDIVLPPASTK